MKHFREICLSIKYQDTKLDFLRNFIPFKEFRTSCIFSPIGSPTTFQQRGNTLPLTSFLGYDNKPSDCVAPEQKIWGMLSASSLPLHPGQL